MKLIASTAAFLLTFLVVFLMGCFIAVDFNIANWTTDGRFFTMMLCLISSISCAMVAFNMKEFR